MSGGMQPSCLLEGEGASFRGPKVGSGKAWRILFMRNLCTDDTRTASPSSSHWAPIVHFSNQDVCCNAHSSSAIPSPVNLTPQPTAYCDDCPACSTIEASFALASDLFSPCLPFCIDTSARVLSRVDPSPLLFPTQSRQIPERTHLPFSKPQVHLSSPLSNYSLVLLQRSSDDARGDREVAVVAGGFC